VLSTRPAVARSLNFKDWGERAELDRGDDLEGVMFNLNRKKLLLVGGYLAFNVIVTATCFGALARITSALSRVDLGMGEVLSHILGSILPRPF
jgi:hypothetical protein